jgi:hypothetical protein
MKQKNILLAVALLPALFFAACEKNDNGPVLTAKEKALIGTGAGKIWKLQSLTVPKSDDPSVDSSIMQPCADSALMAFDMYKAYQLANGSKGACDSIAVPYSIGNWSLSVGGDSLLLHGKRDLIWKLETLDENTLKAVFRDSIAPDKKWVKTIILK